MSIQDTIALLEQQLEEVNAKIAESVPAELLQQRDGLMAGIRAMKSLVGPVDRGELAQPAVMPPTAPESHEEPEFTRGGSFTKAGTERVRNSPVQRVPRAVTNKIAFEHLVDTPAENQGFTNTDLMARSITGKTHGEVYKYWRNTLNTSLADFLDEGWVVRDSNDLIGRTLWKYKLTEAGWKQAERVLETMPGDAKETAKAEEVAEIKKQRKPGEVMEGVRKEIGQMRPGDVVYMTDIAKKLGTSSVTDQFRILEEEGLLKKGEPEKVEGTPFPRIPFTVQHDPNRRLHVGDGPVK